MEINNKGVFFTFIALFVIILVVAVVTTKDTYRYRERSSAIYSRVKTMNNFIQDFDEDLERELFIGGYRALISMNAYVRQIQGYVTDLDETFTEILVNGTADNGNITMSLMRQETQGADINSWVARVNEEADELNIITSVKVHEVSIQHITPWTVEVRLNATINISDVKGLASWVFDKEYKQEFSIIGFEDPLYTVETSDKVTNLVNITPNMTFIGPNNDTTILEGHLLNSYYINHTDAPSFLMRFTGNLSSSPFGIESMVNVEELFEQGLLKKNRSVIDYLYFGEQTTTGIGKDYCDFTDLDTDVRELFRIERVPNDHLILYGVNDLSKSPC